MLRKILFCVVGSAVLFCVTVRLFSQTTAASEVEFDVIAHRANMPGMPENSNLLFVNLGENHPKFDR